MPGWEIIGKEERNSINKLFDEGGVLFAHGFGKFRKRYHVENLKNLQLKNLI